MPEVIRSEIKATLSSLLGATFGAVAMFLLVSLIALVTDMRDWRVPVFCAVLGALLGAIFVPRWAWTSDREKN
ncbi:MAG: hypothetical protein KF799_06770 [Bdellovibrionales bacterium]|nr:hypothetical protein [Bdellovibrionales bacterium]